MRITQVDSMYTVLSLGTRTNRHSSISNDPVLRIHVCTHTYVHTYVPTYSAEGTEKRSAVHTYNTYVNSKEG